MLKIYEFRDTNITYILHKYFCYITYVDKLEKFLNLFKYNSFSVVLQYNTVLRYILLHNIIYIIYIAILIFATLLFKI